MGCVARTTSRDHKPGSMSQGQLLEQTMSTCKQYISTLLSNKVLVVVVDLSHSIDFRGFDGRTGPLLKGY